MLTGTSGSLRDHPIEFIDSRNELEAILIDVVSSRFYRVSLQIYICTARTLKTLFLYQKKKSCKSRNGGIKVVQLNHNLLDRPACELRDAELMRAGNGRFRADDLLCGVKGAFRISLNPRRYVYQSQGSVDTGLVLRGLGWL